MQKDNQIYLEVKTDWTGFCFSLMGFDANQKESNFK